MNLKLVIWPLLLATSAALTISSSSALRNHRIINQQQQIIGASTSTSQITKRHTAEDAQFQSADQHFGPKLIHQPQSATVQANKPHTVECAIESEPEAEVKWFKDDQLLGSQPTHLEQQGSELMFFQMNEEDTGEYRCQAANYLGSVSSEPFRLTVHSSVHEPRIRFEPKLAEAGLDQMVELTCSIPVGQQTNAEQSQAAGSGSDRPSSSAEVSWRRNGRKLLVEWTENNEDILQARNRFIGRQVGPSQFSLTILRTQLRDDNSTFTCLYKLLSPSQDHQAQAQAQAQQDQEQAGLARESSPVLLRVYQQPAIYPMNNTNLGAPIEELINARPPADHHADSNNHTTRLHESIASTKSVQEAVRALFELAKPVLSIVGVLALIGLLVGLQLIYMRRRSSCCQSSNRYMKHHHHQSYGSSASSSAGACSAGSGTGGSASSAGSGILDRDPVLSTLLGRTLSAPSSCAKAAAAAATLAGGGSKKYRSYRDHMRKVAAVQEDPVVSHTDLVDSYLAQLASGGGGGGGTHSNLFLPNQQSQAQQLHLPNLYNQSLAAREQARSLLQASSEHMRSLSNLNQAGKHLHRSVAAANAHQLNGSHLNLPLSFAFPRSTNTNNNNGPLSEHHGLSGALWPAPHPKQMSARGPQLQAPQYDEHYQLVDCSNPSVSPSTASSIAGNSSGAQIRRSSSELTGNKNRTPASEQGNHYSTIDINDDDDDDDDDNIANESEAYEELDQHQQQVSGSSKRISSFLAPAQDQHHSNNSAAALPVASSRRTTNRQTHYPDQPSPYAVSSICSSSTSKPAAAAPPVNSEAMRALTEQFDINHLMLLDGHDTLAGQQLPPPPPPPASTRPSAAVAAINPVERQQKQKRR